MAKTAGNSRGQEWTYSEVAHRKEIQIVRIDIIKFLMGIHTFALAVPAVILLLMLEKKIPMLALSQKTILLVFFAWASSVFGLVCGAAYVSLAPRWILWRKHERFLNASYALCPIFLLVSTIFIAWLYLFLVTLMLTAHGVP